MTEPTDTSEPMTSDQAAAEARRLIADAYRPPAADAYQPPTITSYRDPTITSYRDPTYDPSAGPTVGDTPPVPQPGRPPMSQRATDHVGVVAAYSLGALPVGGAVSLVLWVIATVPTPVLALIAAAPPALALSIGAASRMIGQGAAEAAQAQPQPVVHQHYGPSQVQHTQVETRTNTLLGRTTNHLPPPSNPNS